MKALIIGTSLSGKTTLVRYLRANIKFPLLEMDEELTRVNNGVYPKDDKHKHRVLIPQIVKDVLCRNEVVFFTNTDYFTSEDLEIAQKWISNDSIISGFTRIAKRNKFRVENEGYSDLSQWLEGMINYQAAIKRKGLIDKVIEAKQTTENIANELIEFLE